MTDARDPSNQVASQFNEIYVRVNQSSLEDFITHPSYVNLILLSEVDTTSLMILFSMEKLKVLDFSFYVVCICYLQFWFRVF